MKSVSELKEMALNDALTKANADVLIEPRYDISTSGTCGYHFYPRGLNMDTGAIQTIDKSHKRARIRRIAGLSVGSFLGAFLITGIFAWIF